MTLLLSNFTVKANISITICTGLEVAIIFFDYLKFTLFADSHVSLATIALLYIFKFNTEGAKISFADHTWNFIKCTLMLFTNSCLTLTTLESNTAILTDQFRAFKAAFVTDFTKCLKTSSTLRLAFWAVSLSFADIALFATVMTEPKVTSLALC